MLSGFIVAYTHCCTLSTGGGGQCADSIQGVFGADFGEALLKCVVASHSEAHCVVCGIVWRTSLFGFGF